MVKTTHSAEETKAAGRELAARLRPGDLVLLEGPLGSGKTTFVQGIAEGLGAVIPATSPSFVIVNEYSLARSQAHALARSVLRHVDLYRLSDPTVDLDRIGLPELLADPSAITVVEWAERLPPSVPAEAQRATAGAFATARSIVRVRLDHAGDAEARALTVAGV